uniref:Fibronectin type-III domain-containing protein n=1 Tax=Amphimedon queenslandica TaxID=400682 RepID=A0A1X7SZN1_AMPQE
MALLKSSCFQLLLLALVQLVSVSGQAPLSTVLPSNGVQLYLPFLFGSVPDYSMIYASQFYDVDQNNDDNNIVDALWCQSANNGTDIGVWYYPNGTEVPLFDGNFGNTSAPRPLFSRRFSGQIALARREGLLGYEGLYKCIIPDENGVNQTLVVGAYTDTGYNNNDGPDADPTMQISLLSTSRLATPPVFSLSFNVSDGPPTTVSCSVNGTEISTELSRKIVNGPESVTRVTVANFSEAGNYQCTVSNTRVTNGTISGFGPNAVISTSSLNISVSDTPTGLNATRLSTGLAHVRLYWSTVSGATGYEVYYQLSSNTPVSVSNTSYTTINITSGLFRGVTYTFYVVSYGSAFLPSGNASVTLTIIYEIRYRESTSTGPYNITNTTNTYYVIVELIPNTSYTIGVRAYTSIGPGEWTNREYTTIEIPVIQTFSITKLNSTAVRAEWSFVSGASHYTVYYESTSSSSRKKRQVETGMRVFPGDTTEGLIGGLDPNLNYLFSISTSFNSNGIIYEGERTQPIPPNVTVTPTILSRTSSICTQTLTDISSIHPAVTSIVTVTTTVAITILVNNNEGNNGDNTGLIVGVTVVYIPIILLALALIILVCVLCKNKAQK